MIIFGWGRRTQKVVGQSNELTCPVCGRLNRFNLLEVKTWFSLFFIPVIPYENRKFAVCPNCNNGRQLSAEDFKAAQTTGNIPSMSDQHGDALAQRGF